MELKQIVRISQRWRRRHYLVCHVLAHLESFAIRDVNERQRNLLCLGQGMCSMTRRHWIAAVAVPAILMLAATASAAPGASAPVLTPDDARYAGLEDLQVTTSSSMRMQAEGITAEEAIEVAIREWSVDKNATAVLTARAAQYPGEELRPVFVVVASGGVFPFDGPPGGPVSGQKRVGRVTGLLVDATTGEFLRGFIHN